MKLRFAAATLAVIAMPAFALAQTGGAKAPKTTKADVQKVVQTISGDKAKMQTYCDLTKVNQQMAAADEKKNTKLVESLGAKADGLSQKLGPDYAKMMDGLESVDENSAEGKEINATLELARKEL